MKLLLLFILMHGVRWEPVEGAHLIRVTYDDGTPMSYATVEVFNESGKKIGEFEADSLGIFYFIPQEEGGYELRVSDGMGHGVIINIKGGKVVEKSCRLTPLIEALIGASLLWGLAGTLFYFLARRKYAHS